MNIEPRVTSAHPTTRRLRIVLAEDDAVFRAAIRDVLGLEGHLVREAADGEELLGLILRGFSSGAGASTAVDLIISDIWMPRCSGLRVLEQLRAARWSTPMLLMSGDDDPELLARIDALGGTLLRKPFFVAALREAISVVVSRPGRAPAEQAR